MFTSLSPLLDWVTLGKQRHSPDPASTSGAFDVSLGLQRWAGLGWAGLGWLGWLGCNRRGYTSNTPPHSQLRILWPRRGLGGAQSSIPFFLPFEGQDMGHS